MDLTVIIVRVGIIPLVPLRKSEYGDIDEFDGRKLLDKDYVTEFTLNDKQHDHIYRINFQTEDKTGKEEVAEENNCINKQHK